MKLNLLSVVSRFFTFTNNSLVTEHSDLPVPIFQRMYDDACDLGFCMESSRTGKKATFVYSHDEKRDGEVIAFHFTPTLETVREIPSLKNVKVVVYND